MCWKSVSYSSPTQFDCFQVPTLQIVRCEFHVTRASPKPLGICSQSPLGHSQVAANKIQQQTWFVAHPAGPPIRRTNIQTTEKSEWVGWVGVGRCLGCPPFFSRLRMVARMARLRLKAAQGGHVPWQSQLRAQSRKCV